MRNLTSWESLQPLIGTTSEGADLDFKRTLDPTTSKSRIEFAKDVAALANGLGGHVLVGASTDMGSTRCTGFPGIERELATKIGKAFEEQVKSRCRPTPLFNVQSIDVEGTPNCVVVISVEASPNAPIGVSLKQENPGFLVDEGWAFPYRVCSQTLYLHPDQFGVYESMSARRATAFLNSIPPEERQWVHLRWVVHGGIGRGYGDGEEIHFESVSVRFVGVELLGNVASFLEPIEKGERQIDVPSDQIQTVWRKGKKGSRSWEVSIIGSLDNSDGEWQHLPPP